MLRKMYDYLSAPYRIMKNRWGYLLGSFFGSFGCYITTLLYPLAGSKIIEYAITGNQQQAFLWVLFLTISYLFYTIACYCNYIFYSKNAEYMVATLYQKYYYQLSNVDNSFENKFSNGKIVKTILSDIQYIPYFIDSTFEFILPLVTIFIVIILLAFTDPISALFIIVGLCLYVWYVLSVAKKYGHSIDMTKRQDDAVNEVFSEELSGLRELKTLHILRPIHQKMINRKKRYMKMLKEQGKYQEKMENSSELIIWGIKFGLYFILFFLLFLNNFPLAKIILVIGYFDLLVEVIEMGLISYSEIVQYKVSTDRVLAILNYGGKHLLEGGNYSQDHIYGSIVFDHVSYTSGHNTLLNDVNFKIEPHTITSIVGKSGSGKSALLELLIRISKPAHGMIYLDGHDISEYSNLIYSNNITLVKQNPFFFHMSIGNNLNLVNRNKYDQREACERVGLHDFISTLKDGYRTILKNNAANLSGGQKQLLSIARALLTNAEILLFDEVTSSLDPNTSKKIAMLLENLKQDHTVLIVTNRKNIMELSDQILYVEDGGITSYRTFQELEDNIRMEESICEKI